MVRERTEVAIQIPGSNAVPRRPFRSAPGPCRDVSAYPNWSRLLTTFRVKKRCHGNRERVAAAIEVVIVPLWQMAGTADWICHRATNIEGTTGAKESLMHLLMLTEVSIPVLAGFHLEITAPCLPRRAYTNRRDPRDGVRRLSNSLTSTGQLLRREPGSSH